MYQTDFNIEEVAKTGKMRMPDKKKVVKFIPIPMYYRRKLFYEQVMKDDGKLMWKLKDNDLSRTFYKNATYRQAAVLSGIYTNVYNELKVADRIKGRLLDERPYDERFGLLRGFFQGLLL